MQRRIGKLTHVIPMSPSTLLPYCAAVYNYAHAYISTRLNTTQHAYMLYFISPPNTHPTALTRPQPAHDFRPRAGTRALAEPATPQPAGPMSNERAKTHPYPAQWR